MLACQSSIDSPGVHQVEHIFYFKDKDECYYNNGGCSQQCINEISGYSCKCDIGFTLKNDNYTCEECKHYYV